MSFPTKLLPIAAVLLLAGCVPVSQVPPEPRGAELDALIAQELEFQWQYVGLAPGDARPAVDRIRIVSLDEAEEVHRQCMVEAGYGDFRQVTASIYGGASTLERLAIYTCSAQYPVPPSSYGLFSEAQRGYLYDYYTRVTVPCIESSGLTVDSVPTREEFMAPETHMLGLWHPYRSVRTETDMSYLSKTKCPYVPEGFNPF